MIDFNNDISFIKDNKLFRLRVGAIIIIDNHVLMVKNNTNSYMYSVGGAVAFNETLEEALHREINEEVGVHLEIDKLLVVHQNFFVDHEIGHEKWHELSFYYLMKPSNDIKIVSKSVNLRGEKEQLVWVNIETYTQNKAFPAFFKDLNKLKKLDVPTFIITTS